MITSFLRVLFFSLVSLSLLPGQDSNRPDKEEEKDERHLPAGSSRIEPTFADVRYGEHERNTFDVWLPKAPEFDDGLPFPVLVFFHGGGFVGGSKESFSPRDYLAAGIACVSANYRFVDGKEALSPSPMEDGARVIHTIRRNAVEWNLDGGRLAVSGSSAGAVIAMWIAYHDDLARLDAKDPVSRQSSRVSCAVPINGPTHLMPDWIVENIGGSQQVHSSFPKMFGADAGSQLSAEVIARIKRSSPNEYASEDDPPSLLLYHGAVEELPLPADADQGRIIHHPHFGTALKASFDKLGVECEFRDRFDPGKSPLILNYLKNKFSMVD